MRKPFLIVAGTGRDGTTSMAHFLHDLFAEEGGKRRVAHEFAARECYNRFDRFARTGDRSEMEALRKVFRTCPFDAIVGNGYAFVLSQLGDAVPEDTLFIHLKRDREACIRSLVKHCELFPESQGHYSLRKDVDYHVWRTAAFHLGEMSKEAWDALPMEEKFAWYYDRTHSLLEEASRRFPRHMAVHTETIDQPETMQRIADFAGIRVDRLPAPRRSNTFTYFDVSMIDPFYIPKSQWLYGDFNFKKSLENDAYCLNFFCKSFFSWHHYLSSEGEKDEYARYVTTQKALRDEMGHGIAVLRKWLFMYRLMWWTAPIRKPIRRALNRFPRLREQLRRRFAP
jgi:hypothetical protein